MAIIKLRARRMYHRTTSGLSQTIEDDVPLFVEDSVSRSFLAVPRRRLRTFFFFLSAESNAI
jgi:hypothetical protein